MAGITNLQKILTWDNHGIHNFSHGCLESYFKLNENILSGRGKIIQDGIVYLAFPKPKTFVFQLTKPIDLKPFQEKGPIYSIKRLDLPGESNFKEIAYDLKQVFNPNSYQNAKKRHQRIIYPFKKLTELGIEAQPLTEKNLHEAKILHDKWCEKKLENPKTYKIMFSSKRYYQCCLLCISSQSSGGFFFEDKYPMPPNYKGVIFYSGIEPIAVRVISIQKTTAYDLAFFTNFWDSPSQTSNYLNVYFMKMLFEQGIKTLNCGSSLNPSLKQFKQHYPNSTIISYSYSKRSI